LDEYEFKGKNTVGYIFMTLRRAYCHPKVTKLAVFIPQPPAGLFRAAA
jgi:hypothetical protein